MFDQTRSYEYKGRVEPSDVLVTKIHNENKNINSLLSSLMTTKYFRIFKVNLLRECEFFNQSGKCRLNQCPIYEEEAENVTHIKTYLVNETLDPKTQEFTKHIPVDAYVGNGEDWIADEHLDEEGVFVDLSKNPERYSGYNGSHIWYEVYEGLKNLNFSTHGVHENFLYKIVSGIHVNINMHISHYFLEDIDTREDVKLIDYQPKYDIFYERVGKHPERIQNLFFTYVLLIDALSKIKVNLPHYTYYTYDEAKNMRIQNRMKWFGHYISGILDPGKIKQGLFDEISQEEFISTIKPVFRNITDLFE